MTVKSRTQPSTPRLSEYARKFTYPAGITRTVWPRVESKGRELGLGFDWWQSQLGTVCLGYGDDGKYVATVGGVGLSIPRQVGKTYFVLALLVIMCILFPGLQVVWTAHHLRTSTKTFTHLRGICRRKRVAPHIKALRAANGEQQAEFTNGSMIMFGSRARGFGRGFDEVDVEVFDEAQILDTKSLEDMIAATNQARHEHGALLFFMGTPPRDSDPSEAFTARRSEAWAGEAEDAIWLEIGADPESSADDRSQFPLMNPSFPLRTPMESMQRLRKNLKDEGSWNREGRGIWDELKSNQRIMPTWPALVSADAPGRPAALGVAMDLDRIWLSCGSSTAGPVPHVGPVTSATVDRVLRVRAADPKFGKAQFVAEVARISRELNLPVVLDRKGAASDLEDDLIAAGAQVHPVGVDDLVTADAEFYDAAEAREVVHGDYAELNDAVTAAGWRKVGQRRAFAAASGEVSMLSAVSLAHWGAKHAVGASVYDDRDLLVL